MTHQVALTFEDGVTRFVEVDEGEPVADAALRVGINLPIDCMDGVCGSCKSFCESGEYELGHYEVGYSMTEEEERAGFVLTCQLHPKSDLVISVPVDSHVADVEPSTHAGRITSIERLSETTTHFSVQLDHREGLSFLPGQYVNIPVPGTSQTRSYSFSSGPAADEITFLLRNITNGVMSTYVLERAEVNDSVNLVGPLGSFYLRPVQRPVLFLAGGTGLAPFLSMLERLTVDGSDHPIRMIYGVTNDPDLVRVAELERAVETVPGFSFSCCVADPASAHPNTGYVTRYIEPQDLNGGDVDIYLCGPPPMVDAVRDWLADQGVVPANFYFEKFSSTGLVSEIGTIHS
jgi:benzoate/toluate 1,2-dioxygenase reductase subunit